MSDERPSVFGALVAASDVESALLAHVQVWLRDYLAEVDRQHDDDVGALIYPRGWVISSDVEKMPEDQTPTIVIASPGLVDPPRADGVGVYTARWEVGVSIVLSALGGTQALVLARRYALALRALVLQQQNIDADALTIRRVDWADERYDVLETIDDRTICVGRVDFVVEVADVTTRNQGPMTPTPPPLGPDSPRWPVALDGADVLVTKE